MAAIFKRELRSYFQTMTGWVFLAVSIFITSMYFISVNLTFGESDFSYTLSSVIFMFIFTIPVLTMKVISEERKQKTDQLILTSPVSIWRIVAAKYLAMLAVFLIPIIVFSLFPLIMTSFGETAVTESYSALIGFFLLGAACIAAGLFISSLTESLVISAILTIAVLFVAYQVDGIAYMISSTGNIFTDLLHVFDLVGYYTRISGGKLDLTAIVYFLSVIWICLFLTVQMIRKRSYTISRKGFAPGAYSIGMTAIGIAAAVFINLAVSALPDRYTQLDMTSNKLYSLTDTTKSMLSGLTKDVNIYVLNSEENEDELLGETLEGFSEASEHIKVEYRDPVEYPDFYKAYTDGNISFNSLIVECGDKSRVIEYTDCYTTAFDYGTFQMSAEGYDGEGQLISAVDYVTRDSLPKIYVLTGHGEAGLDTGFEEALTKANIETEELNLVQYDAVPADAKAIYIASPKKDLTESEASKLDEYIKAGGKLIATTYYTNAFEEAMPYFSRVLAEFGVSVEDGLVYEADRKNYFQHPSYLLPEIKESELTEGVYDESYVFMPTAQGIAVDDEAEDVSVSAFLQTGGDAYIKTAEETEAFISGQGENAAGSDDTSQGENAYTASEQSEADNAYYSEAAESGEEVSDKQDATGEEAIDLGIHAVKTVGDKEAELVLCSSEYIFTDSANLMTTGGNLEIFTNIAAKFTDSESNISIPVKMLSGEHLMVSQGTRFQLTMLLTVIAPAALLITGFVIMFRRRKR